jgi:activator of HSP90 ATPase
MAKTITQRVTFKNVSVATLYGIYLDSKKHTAAIGASASITPKEGALFSSFDKYTTGRNLQLVKNRLIVQSWRAIDWNKTDIDSTFILRFEQDGKDAVVHMVHANIPDKYVKSIKDGWNKFYWQPWKEYLSK